MSPLDRLPGESELQLATRMAALMRAPRATGATARFVAAVQIDLTDGAVIEAGSSVSPLDLKRLGYRKWQAVFESMVEDGLIVPVAGDTAEGQPSLITSEGSAATADLADQVADILLGAPPATDAGRRGTPAAAASPGVAGASAPAAPRSAMWPLRDLVADTRLALEAGEAFDRRKAAERDRARAEAPSGPAAAAPAATAPRDPTRPWVMP